MRLLVLYLRSRQIPTAGTAAALGVAALWTLNLRTADTLLGMLAVLAGVAAAGPGLAGPDLDLDRTAAIAWPPRRAAHVIAACTIVAGIVTAAALTTKPIAPAAQIARDTLGMCGLLALGAATLGASRAWIPPLTGCLLGWTLLTTTWPPPAYHPVLAWMFQPTSSTPATITALTLAATGTLTYAFRGPRA